MPDPDKKMLREIKRAIKKSGNRHRRRQLDRNLADNPEEAHLSEEDLGRKRSDAMNGLDSDNTRDRERPNKENNWVFILVCYYEDEMINEIALPNLMPSEVRHAFVLRKDEYPGDCLEVKEVHLEWLKEKIGKMIMTSTSDAIVLDLDKFDYFLEVRQVNNGNEI